MTTPKFIVTAVNTPFSESITKGRDRENKIPAFYTLTTPDDKVYAGSTGSIGKRLSRHKADLNSGIHSYKELQDVVEGDKNILVTVQYTPTREAAFEIEQDFINNNVNNSNLLNKATDVRKPGTGISPTEYGIQRIKETHTGKIVSEETRRKLSEANAGKIISEEQKQKLREANLGKVHSLETIEKCRLANIGRKHSKESIEKMSEAKKGKPFPQAALEASMKIRCVPVIYNGTEYSSFAEAAKSIGVSDVTFRNRALSNDPKFSNYSIKKDESN